MASFSDTIRLTVDVVTGNATGALGKLRSEVANTEGAWGKMKKAGSNAFDAIKANAAGFAVGAGAALVAFGVKAVSSFQDVALGAGELRDKLGLTADQASRWQEVAGDLGIANDTLVTVIGRMNKNVGQSPALFKDLGVQIAYARDGSVDANGTFLNVIDRLHGMKDPAQRAAAAQKLLGKSWTQAAELINAGADSVRARLKDVESQKIVSDDQINQARAFRDALDNLHDKVEDLSITVGKDLVPALTDTADGLTKATDAAGPLVDAFFKVYGAIRKVMDLPSKIPVVGFILGGPFQEAIGLLGKMSDAWHGMFGGGQDDPTKLFAGLGAGDAYLATLRAGADKASQGVAVLAKGLKKAIDEVNASQTAIKDFHNTIKSTDFGKAALEGGLTASHNYTDSLFGLSGIASDSEKAVDDFGDSIKDANGKVKASTLTFDLNTEAGRKQRDALKGISNTLDTQFAAAFAGAHGKLDVFRGKANEISNNTLKRLQTEFGLSDDQVNGLRKSLGLTAKDWDARFKLAGTEEARVKIGLLQGSINSLPKDVQTRVNQQIIKGDYVGAVSTIQGYYNRNPLHVRVNVVPGGNFLDPNHRATGGTVGRNEPVTLVGERGPELVSLPAGSKVTPAGATAAMLRPGAGGVVAGGASGDIHITNNIHVSVGHGTNPVAAGREVYRVLEAHLKTGGAAQLRQALGLAPVGVIHS
jgi:hypothetical protein